MPSVSSQPFFCLSEANKSVFCCINGLKMFVLSRLIIIKPVAIHLIRKVSRSAGIPSFAQQPFCSLHLHLEMSENPYTSGPVTSKKTVPGIIVATGRVALNLRKGLICRDVSGIQIRYWKSDP